MADLFKAGGQIHIDASAIPKEVIAAANEAQKTANNNPVKITITTDSKVIEKQLKKDQKTLFKELEDSYKKYSDFKLDDKGFAKAIQMYVASGGELNKAFKEIALSYNDLQYVLKDGFIPLEEIELFKNSMSSLQKTVDNVDFSKVDFSKLEKLNNTLKKIYTEGYLTAEISDEEFVAYVKDFERQGGIFTADLKEIKEAYEQYVDDMSNMQIPKLSLLDFGDPNVKLKQFFDTIRQYANDNGLNKLDNFFLDLEKRIANGDDAAKQMLKTLGLLKGEAADAIKAGNVHYGGLVGDEMVAITRRDDGNRYEETLKLKDALEQAASEGIQVARILDVIKDEQSELFLEIQEAAPGQMLAQTFSPFGEEFDFVNLDALKASKEQVEKFIKDLIRLNELGIGVDFNTTNFMFDKEKGFSFIDLDLKPEQFENNEEIVEKAKRLLSDIREYYSEIADTSQLANLDSLEQKFNQVGYNAAKAISDGYAEGQDSHSPSKVSEELNDDFVAGIEESANKNVDKLKNIGGQMADDIKAGFKEGMSEIDSTSLPSDQSGVLSSNQTEVLSDNQTPLSLVEESSGQLAMFEGVEEQQKEIRQSVEKTNDAIEGQITLVDYLNEQKSKPVEPIKDTFDEQHTSDIKAETDAIKENTDALKENEQAKKKQSKSKNKEVITNPSKEGFKTPTGWMKDVNKAWDNANSENAIKNYEELINKVERYYSLLAKNKKSELTNDEELEFKSLQKQIENATKSLDGFNGKGKDFNEIIKKFKTRIGELDKKSGLTDLYGKDGRNDVFNQLSSDNVVSSKINGYEQRVNDLKTVFLEIKNLVPIDITNQKEVDRLDELNKQFDELAQNLNSDKYDPANQSDINKWTGKISDTLFKNTNAPKEIRRNMEALVEQLKQVGLSQADIRRIKEEFERLESQMKATGKTGDSLGTKIKKKFKDVAAYFATYVSIQDAIQVIRQGFETIKEYDIALTEMNKVSDESIQTLKEFQKESFDLANTIGTTAQQIQNSTADWMRLGESLEDAKQSAQDANILFNVSEFGSIDEATESLVAMSQAYDELEKIDIVDIMNNIGNNYSISTNELSSALQKSAATLKVAGNDIYEATALITAGNAILQDADTVGTGLKMISLRILGTEEAKDELASLGEDVDDFVVQTQSKLDETIRNYTAVASNDFKGISILDDNGNYKSTYEILRDISQVYQEILETDKKAGTNRGQALLEVLAGKNRSNVAASILSSPDLLTSVYESALDSEGSALKENEAYLESIQGHLDQLKNSWDNLWINENNREVITFFLDLAKSVLDVVNEFGALNTLLVGGGGIFAAVKAFKGDGRLKMSSLIFM